MPDRLADRSSAGLLRRALLAMLAGVALVLALAPLHIWPGLLGFAGLLHLLMTRRSRREAALLGWAFGFGFFLAGLYWIGIAFFTDAERFGALAVPAVILLCAALAAFPALAALAFSAIPCRKPLAGALLLAVLWIGSELLRAHFLWGFPWNLIGYVWAGAPLMAQAAAWLGVYGLGLLTVLIGAAPATALLLSGRQRWAGPAVAAGLLLLLGIGGALRLQGADSGTVADIRLRLVQGNIAQEYKWDPERRAEAFRRHLDMSWQGNGPGGPVPTHIIWPESATPYLLDRDEVARAMIAEVVPPGGLLITGANRFDLESEPRRAWNSLQALDGEGRIRARYDKHRLVPFGEFLPWRAVLGRIGLKKITEGTIDFQPGDGAATIDLPDLPAFSPLICYEVIFSGEVVDSADRPAWLLNLTNDAWFGRSSGPYQHLAMARMRAIEEGLPLVRSANTGISAVIDPFGRIQAVLGLGAAGVIDAPLPRALERPTPYARFGALGLAILVALSGIFFVIIEKSLIR
jgi:apolipoprotein N-acyltransferase